MLSRLDLSEGHFSAGPLTSRKLTCTDCCGMYQELVSAMWAAAGTSCQQKLSNVQVGNRQVTGNCMGW